MIWTLDKLFDGRLCVRIATAVTRTPRARDLYRNSSPRRNRDPGGPVAIIVLLAALLALAGIAAAVLAYYLLKDDDDNAESPD